MKYLYKLFSVVTLISICHAMCQSQEIRTIRGIVTSGKEKIDGFSAVLLSVKDSTIYKGDYFTSDEFSFETEVMPVLLRISSFGYMDTTYMVENADRLININLMPKDILLDEIVVTSQSPVFLARPGHYTMNVDVPSLRQSGTAADLLRKVARVKVNEKQEVSVLGVGNAVVFVDGHQLPDNSTLASIVSSEIKKIEVITNPSAAYDAEGKAVVEITTKRPSRKPWGVEVTTRMGKGKFWRKYIGAEATASLSALSLYAFYAYNPQKELFTEDYLRDYTMTSSPMIINNEVRTVNNAINHNYRFSADLRIADCHNLGLQISGYYVNTSLDINDINNVKNHTGDQTQMYLADQTGILRKEYSSGTLYHSYNSLSGKVKWNTLLDYSLYDTDKGIDISETGSSGQIFKRNSEQTHIDIFSCKSGVYLRLPQEFMVETGAKFIYSRNNSNTQFITPSKENLSGYNYHEKITAFYLTGSKQFSRLRIDAGLRMEASWMHARTYISKIQDRRHIDLFPNISFNYQLCNDWSLNASYAKKITRPTFQDLNPALTYTDSFSYSQGNPTLVPEICHNFDIKLLYNGASLSVGYTRNHNSFAWHIEQDAANPAVIRATQININRSESFSADLTLPYQNKYITTYLSTGLIFTKTKDSYSDVINLKRPMWYCYSGLDLSLPWNLRFNATAGYYTKGVVNIFTTEPMLKIDAGISRTFFGDKMSVSLMWNDIFHSAKMASYSVMNKRYLKYSLYNDQSLIMLAVSFRLNNIKDIFKSRSAIEDETKRIKGL